MQSLKTLQLHLSKVKGKCAPVLRRTAMVEWSRICIHTTDFTAGEPAQRDWDKGLEIEVGGFRV